MAVLTIWRTNPEQVENLSVQQVLAWAGDGKLRDGSECSREIRDFLQEVPSSFLSRYASQCLESGFAESGFVLQDLVNEIGRRLEFQIEHGLYRGRRDVPGHDGIWKSPQEGTEIIVEVKTTDYVNVSLDRLAEYRRRLVRQEMLSPDASFLIVVGREDTGALEAQVRGSRYAWDMRLISVDRLSDLLNIKERSNEDNTVRQIRELLRPFEYTKIDKIIDVMFAAAEDTGDIEHALENGSGTEATTEVRDRTLSGDLNGKRLAAVEAFGRKRGVPLRRHRQTLFSSAHGDLRVCAAVSKRYDRDYQPYWYAYHPQWHAFLREGQDAFFDPRLYGQG